MERMAEKYIVLENISYRDTLEPVELQLLLFLRKLHFPSSAAPSLPR